MENDSFRNWIVAKIPLCRIEFRDVDSQKCLIMLGYTNADFQNVESSKDSFVFQAIKDGSLDQSPTLNPTVLVAA